MFANILFFGGEGSGAGEGGGYAPCHAARILISPASALDVCPSATKPASWFRRWFLIFAKRLLFWFQRLVFAPCNHQRFENGIGNGALAGNMLCSRIGLKSKSL